MMMKILAFYTFILTSALVVGMMLHADDKTEDAGISLRFILFSLPVLLFALKVLI